MARCRAWRADALRGLRRVPSTGPRMTPTRSTSTPDRRHAHRVGGPASATRVLRRRARRAAGRRARRRLPALPPAGQPLRPGDHHDRAARCRSRRRPRAVERRGVPRAVGALPALVRDARRRGRRPVPGDPAVRRRAAAARRPAAGAHRPAAREARARSAPSPSTRRQPAALGAARHRQAAGPPRARSPRSASASPAPRRRSCSSSSARSTSRSTRGRWSTASCACSRPTAACGSPRRMPDIRSLVGRLACTACSPTWSSPACCCTSG